MVSSITMLVLIGAGSAFAVGIGHIMHQNLTNDTLLGHWISEEQPDFVIEQLVKLFGGSNSTNAT